MYDYQGMVVLATNQVWWTWEVEDVFDKVRKGDKMAMKNYSKKLHSQIDALVVQVRQPSCNTCTCTINHYLLLLCTEISAAYDNYVDIVSVVGEI